MRTLRNMKIGTRLGVGFAAVIALLIVLAAFGVSRIGAVIGNTELILHDRYVKVALAHTIENEVNRQARALRTALITTDVEMIKDELRQIEDADRQIGSAIDKLQATVSAPKDKGALQALIQTRQAYVQHKAELVKLVAAQSLDEGGVYLIKQMMPAQAAYLSALAALMQTQVEGMKQFGEEATQTAKGARLVMIGLAVVAVVLAMAIAVSMTRSITIPMSLAVKVAQRVAAGDLTSRVDVRSSDEAGQLLRALQAMNAGLTSIVQDVRHSSESIATGSSQIATGNADLSQRTEEQVSNLQQTAASMEQIAATVRQTADVARTAASMAEEASVIAANGGAVVDQVVATMADIAASSREISDITTVIDGIAFQTNILALNAAVEAARAGEQGRGFAVVAGEVRSLAQRAAEAAKEIRVLIGASAQKVDLGSNLVGRAGETMQEIVGRVKHVAQLIAEIDVATQEQTAGIGQVGDAVSQLDHVTQQNAALVEESAAAAESLNQQATKLTDLVGAFKLA